MAHRSDDDEGYIYFFEYEHDGVAMVKIGFATNVEARKHNLQTALPNDLEMILCIPGTVADEKAMHKRLAADHVNREWFRYSDDVDDLIYAIFDARALLAGGDPEYDPTLSECLAFEDAPKILDAMTTLTPENIALIDRAFG